MRNRTAYISITFQLPPAKIAIRKEKVDISQIFQKTKVTSNKATVSSQEEKLFSSPQFFMAFHVL